MELEVDLLCLGRRQHRPLYNLFEFVQGLDYVNGLDGEPHRYFTLSRNVETVTNGAIVDNIVVLGDRLKLEPLDDLV